jgi:4-alpha-glucanotransferase
MFDVIQLLPLNDTTAEASFSPFSARSSFALNPLNISLSELPFHGNDPSRLDSDLWEQLVELNKADRIDWNKGRLS